MLPAHHQLEAPSIRTSISTCLDPFCSHPSSQVRENVLFRRDFSDFCRYCGTHVARPRPPITRFCTRITACYPALAETGPCFVPGLPHNAVASRRRPDAPAGCFVAVDSAWRGQHFEHSLVSLFLVLGLPHVTLIELRLAPRLVPGLPHVF